MWICARALSRESAATVATAKSAREGRICFSDFNRPHQVNLRWQDRNEPGVRLEPAKTLSEEVSVSPMDRLVSAWQKQFLAELSACNLGVYCHPTTALWIRPRFSCVMKYLKRLIAMI